MRKKLILAAVAALTSLLLSVPAFAAEWKSDAAGWWYQNDDGSYPNNGWTWVDGKCYYFNSDGYCLINTQTPDGFTVDSTGAWIVDGVVQTQGSAAGGGSQAASEGVVQWNGLTFTIPAGFIHDTSEEMGACFVNGSRTTVIAIVTETVTGIDGYEDLLNAVQGPLLDETVESYVGTPSGKSAQQFTTGTWYCYQYTDASSMGVPGSMNIYIRIIGNQLQMIFFAGNLTGIDVNSIMNNNLR